MPFEFEAHGLTRKIADFTLTADFALGRGDRMVVQAPSGSGKTSLFRMIAGLEPLDQGRVFLAGQEISTLAPPKRNIGVVFQDAALFESMTVAENAAFGLRMRGVGKRERAVEARRWLERVGLGARAEDAVTHLSGGEKQRVAFVRALIWGPKLLLLDEPFSALDAELRRQLRGVLLELLRESATPMILVTHDREDADALATSRWTIEGSGTGIRKLSLLA